MNERQVSGGELEVLAAGAHDIVVISKEGDLYIRDAAVGIAWACGAAVSQGELPLVCVVTLEKEVIVLSSNDNAEWSQIAKQ